MGGSAMPKKVFTTGQVAGIVKVAPRTVVKWFDSGRLRGYRIPGTQDRRVPREHLVRFLKEHARPLGELEEAADGETVEEGPVGQDTPAPAEEVKPAEGPEALRWLRNNPNGESFPRERFHAPDGSTREAIRFVERLYA